MLCTRAVICDLMFTSYCCPFSISTSLFLMDYQYRNFVPDSKILRFRVMPYWGTGHLWLPDIILHDRKRPQDRSNPSAYALRDRTALEGNSWPLSRWLSLTRKDWVLRWSKNWKSKKLKKWNWSKNWRSKNWRSLFSIKVNKFYSWRNVWDTEKVHWCLRVQETKYYTARQKQVVSQLCEETAPGSQQGWQSHVTSGAEWHPWIRNQLSF